MIDDQLVLKIERLRDDVESFKKTLHLRYTADTKPVVANDLKELAISIAERWLVGVAGSSVIISIIGDSALAERNIHFQRLLTYGERNTLRRKYDQALVPILRNFRSEIIVPLKAYRENSNLAIKSTLTKSQEIPLGKASTVFVGKSFSPTDQEINETIERLFSSLKVKVITGEKPRSSTVSKKVMDRIDEADIFVGVFTRRDKIENKTEWTTSAWVIDEKAYALAKNKKLILMKERGVSSIGGLQGDYEYLEFDREQLSDLLIKIVELHQSVEN